MLQTIVGKMSSSVSTSATTSATGSPSSRSRASSQTSLSPSMNADEQQDKTARLETAESSSTPSAVRNVVFVGAGYVGGPTAAVMAYCNPSIVVTVVDMNQQRIGNWRSQHLPIEEPGLNDVVRIARDGADPVNGGQSIGSREPNLFFSTDCESHIAQADIIFLSVNTPTKTSGIGAGSATDISMFESAARSVALVAKPGAVIVEKSTVPCRTADLIRDIMTFHRPGVPLEVLSNPEFLAEGTAIKDLLNPPRVLIGCSETPSGLAAAERLASVYAHWVPRSSILTVDVWSSELAKLVANAMLAQRISSMNTVSAICERTGANVDNVAKAIGMDPRLGPKFLKAGLGFGGSCFKKDILSLSYLAESLDLPEVSQYWKSVVTINEYQCQRFVKGLLKKLNGSLRGKKIALLGYAFKEDTSDTRETQAAEVVRMLLQEGPSEIAIFDPLCNKEHVEQELTGLFSQGSNIPVLRPKGPVNVCATPYDACSNATAVLVLNESKQFCYPPVLPSATTTTLQDAGSQTRRPRINTLQKDDERHDSLLETVPTLAKLSLPPAHQSAVPSNIGQFRPQPACPSDCRECSIGTDVARHSKEPIDWSLVSSLMHGEKWVFDGRGILSQVELEKLGFRVEAIGKVSTRSKLRSL